MVGNHGGGRVHLDTTTRGASRRLAAMCLVQQTARISAQAVAPIAAGTQQARVGESLYSFGLAVKLSNEAFVRLSIQGGGSCKRRRIGQHWVGANGIFVAG
jgi:hypothetical protein